MDTTEHEPIVNVEFLVEPFVEGAPGPHVAAALEAVATAGLDSEVGPFGTVARGPLSQVSAAIDTMLCAAFTAGATRVSLQLSVDQST